MSTICQKTASYLWTRPCRESGANNVFISEILPKHNLNLTKLFREINDILKEFCACDNVNNIDWKVK